MIKPNIFKMSFSLLGELHDFESILNISMNKPCVYCGIFEGKTRDHVPPKNLFPKPRPADLVTVPCCEACRKGQSLDDEYFTRMISMRHDVVEHPAVIEIIKKVHRGFTKPQKRGFTQSLLNSVKELDLRSREGLYLGRAFSYEVDLERLCRVIERITLGLYFDENGVRLPSGCQCVVYSIDGFGSDDKTVEANLRQLLDQALLGKLRVFGNKVFSSWFQRVEGKDFVTLWAHLVYSRVAFLAVTLPSINEGK